MKHKIIKNDRREYIRSLKDPIYFYKKYVNIYNKATGKYHKFKLNKYQYERLIKLKNLANLR